MKKEPPENHTFDKDAFISACTDAATEQAAVIAGAFETVEARMDYRFGEVNDCLTIIEDTQQEILHAIRRL